MKIVTVNARNRITIPTEARARLGIQAGDMLDVTVKGDEIRYVKRPTAPVRLGPVDDVPKVRRGTQKLD